jgi:hypothetical protein
MGRITDIDEIKQQFLSENPQLEDKINQVETHFIYV